jgi:hypothetical protein
MVTPILFGTLQEGWMTKMPKSDYSAFLTGQRIGFYSTIALKKDFKLSLSNYFRYGILHIDELNSQSLPINKPVTQIYVKRLTCDLSLNLEKSFALNDLNLSPHIGYAFYNLGSHHQYMLYDGSLKINDYNYIFHGPNMGIKISDSFFSVGLNLSYINGNNNNIRIYSNTNILIPELSMSYKLFAI